MDAYMTLQFVGFIVFLGIYFHLKKKINRGENFDGILWGILTGVAGGPLWDIVAYFSIKSLMKGLSKRSRHKGKLTSVMSNTMHEYLIGIIIGSVIGFVIGFCLGQLGIHFSNGKVSW